MQHGRVIFGFRIRRGEKFFTTPNPEPEDDAAMLHALGLEPLPLR